MNRLPRPTRSALAGLLSLALLALAGVARAESIDIGAYTIHYTAVNSTFIQPAIAQRYGITRGERRAFLNIAVLKNLPDGGSEPVSAVIEGERSNLMQQRAPILFREIREGEAIYSIGEFEFSNAEQVHFELLVQPEGEGPAYPLKWSARLFAN